MTSIAETLGARMAHDIESIAARAGGWRPPRLTRLPGDEAREGGPVLPLFRRRTDYTALLLPPVVNEGEPWGLPVVGQISSRFGMRRHPKTGLIRPHKGIDLAVPVGTPVLATAGGRVRRAEASIGGYGQVVEIDHGEGRVTRYAHLHTIGVHLGQQIGRGDVVGHSGTAGTGPHLHYEILRSGRAEDPLPSLAQAR